MEYRAMQVKSCEVHCDGGVPHRSTACLVVDTADCRHAGSLERCDFDVATQSWPVLQHANHNVSCWGAVNLQKTARGRMHRSPPSLAWVLTNQQFMLK